MLPVDCRAHADRAASLSYSAPHKTANQNQIAEKPLQIRTLNVVQMGYFVGPIQTLRANTTQEAIHLMFKQGYNCKPMV